MTRRMKRQIYLEVRVKLQQPPGSTQPQVLEYIRESLTNKGVEDVTVSVMRRSVEEDFTGGKS